MEGKKSVNKPRQIIFDFEFVEGNPCLPISLGMLELESGSEFYAEYPDAVELANSSEWLRSNVAPHLDADSSSRYGSVGTLAANVRKFLGNGPIELIAECGAYDFFLLSQTLGGFQHSPANFPYTYTDTWLFTLPLVDSSMHVEHHALEDCKVLRMRINKAGANWKSLLRA